ncbi:hypothetical protein PVAP13_8KG098000 [Panicum virgatum]|uniref:Uncharacterized protein n=1 Tax=Panicum virgatum TaxID=38727 RepID=A0A8T0PEH9_PANVG|nr:hypothetical protein PVAP13_8KG098000 [Panicum virgatum]
MQKKIVALENQTAGTSRHKLGYNHWATRAELFFVFILFIRIVLHGTYKGWFSMGQSIPSPNRAPQSGERRCGRGQHPPMTERLCSVQRRGRAAAPGRVATGGGAGGHHAAEGDGQRRQEDLHARRYGPVMPARRPGDDHESPPQLDPASGRASPLLPRWCAGSGRSMPGCKPETRMMEAQAMRKEFEMFKKEAKQKYNLAIQQRDEALAQRDEARMQCGVIEFDVEFLRTCLRMAGYRIQELQEKQGKK